MSTLQKPLRDEVMQYVGGGYTSSHQALDLGGPAFHGEPILAEEDGTIHNVQYFGSPDKYNGPGNFVYLIGAEGRLWEHGHVIAFDLAEGTKVTKGQQIGRMGNTGWVVPLPAHTGDPKSGTHLHWGLEVNGARVNPLDYVNNYQGPSSGSNLVQYIYVVTPDDYMGLESIVIKLYGNLDHYYDVLNWNPELKANPDLILVGQQIKYYKPAPPPPPTPVPELDTVVIDLQSQLATAKQSLADKEIEIKNLEREYTAKILSEVQTREDIITKIKEDKLISDAVKDNQIKKLQGEIDALTALPFGNVKFNAANFIVDVGTKSGFFSGIINAWNNFIDKIGDRNIPIISTYLRTDSGKSLAKFDMFVFIGANIVNFALNAAGWLHLAPEQLNILLISATAIKQYLTLKYDKDGNKVLDQNDFQVLGEFIDKSSETK